MAQLMVRAWTFLTGTTTTHSHMFKMRKQSIKHAAQLKQHLTSVEFVEDWCVKRLLEVREVGPRFATETKLILFTLMIIVHRLQTTPVWDHSSASSLIQLSLKFSYLLGTLMKISLTHCSRVSSFSVTEELGMISSGWIFGFLLSQ